MVNVFKKNSLLNPLFKKIFAVVFLLFASLISVTVSAALVFNAPAQDTDGNFTLSWSGIGTYAVLYENVNGTWQGLTGGSQVFSYAVTSKPEGSYVYKLDNFCQTGPYAPTACGSITRTVIVGTPAPTISAIGNVSMNEDTSQVINFTVGGLNQLTVSASSNNTSIISTSGLVLSGTGSARSLTVTPQVNASGSAEITLTVSDGIKSTTRVFTVSVVAINDAPSISSIASTSINEGVAKSGNLNFTIGDIDTAIGNLTVSATSSNSSLVSSSGLAITGTGTARTMVVTPVARAVGSATITLTVSDGALTSSKSFTFSVVDLPATLFISATSSTTGNFTLSWDYARETVKITESKDGGAEYPLPGYTGELPNKLSVNLNRNGSGVYKYTLYDCLHSGNQYGPITTCTPKSSKTITVTLPAPTVTASLNTTTINEGGTATLTWSSTNSNSCSATNISGVSATSGTATYAAPSVMSANQTKSFVVTCTGGGGSISKTLNLTVNWVNDSPVFSPSASVSTNEDTTFYVPFSVSDEETATAALVWSLTSSNQAIVANAGISVDLVNKRLVVVPVANANGSVTLTARATDANGAYSQKTIAVSIAAVNDAPTISALNALTTSQETAVEQTFTVGDVDGTLASQLSVSAVIVSGGLSAFAIEFSQSGYQRTIKINPPITYFGTATIRVDVTDGVTTTSKTFTVTVNNLNTDLSVGNNNGSGNYTLVWKFGDMPVRITESRNGGAASDVFSPFYTSPSGSKIYAKTQDGTYTYKIYDCTAGQSGLTCNTLIETVSVAVAFPIPAIPSLTLPSTTSNTGEFTVSWGGVSYTNSYSLYENGVLVSGVTGLATSKSYLTSSGTAKGTGSYSYQVKACNASGCSALSTAKVISVAKPSTISSVSLALNAATGIPTLTWSIPASASSYEIQQQLNAGSWVDKGSKTASPATLAAVSAAGAYKYQVRACDVAGSYKSCSAWVASNSVSVSLPGTPTATLNAINTTGSFVLSWINPGSTVNYQLKENGVALANRITGTSSTITKPNGTYTYQVAACNAVGCGSYSALVKVDVAKIATLGTVTAALNQSTGVSTLSWAAVSGATTYKIQPQRNGTNYGSVVSTPNAGYALAPVTVAGNYRYQITACAVVGANSNCATPVLSNVVAPIVLTVAPIVTLPMISPTGVYTVKWSEVADADRYEVYENGVKIASVAALSYSYTTANAKASGQYTYQVKACKALCGPASNSAKISVDRSSSSSSSTSSTGIAVLDQPLLDPLNDALDGDVYLGGVSGTHSVGNDGSFNYNLPIVIPPGINNVQPKLSLSYNSNRRNGLVGWGWAISGLSSISRCGASLVRDGYVSGIQHDDNYRYCLDGQRLVEVAANQYRTENESYLHIEKTNHYWQVTDTKGNVSRYGYNTDSYQADDQSSPYVWYVDKQSDVAGNSWSVTYNKDTTNGTHYPNQINYTQNLLLGTDYSVVFGYEDRSDISTKFIAGSKSVINKRLKTIDVKSYGGVIRTYHLKYQQPGETYSGKKYEDPAKTSRLASVSLCFNAGSCAEPVVFDWASRELADFKFVVTDQDVSFYEQNPADSLNVFVDINGDGKPELYKGKVIEVTQTDGTKKRYGPRYKHMDINRDGFEDVIEEVKFKDTGIGVRFFLSNGSQISSTPSADYKIALSDTTFDYTERTEYKISEPTGPNSVHIKNTGPGTGFYITEYVDLNADGLLDVLRYPTICVSGDIRCDIKGEPNDISVALNNGQGFDPFVAWVAEWNGIPDGLPREWYRLAFSDYNGDGLMDFIALGASLPAASSSKNFTAVGINTGSGGFNISQISTTDRYSLIGDFNGDGIFDLLLKNAELNGNNQDLKYCGAERYTNLYQYIEPGDSRGIVNDSYIPDECYRSVIDFNGDGLDDVVKWGLRRKKSASSAEPEEIDGYVYLSLGLDSDGKNIFAAPITYRDTALWNAVKAKFNEGLSSPKFQFTDYHAQGTFADSPFLENKLRPNAIAVINESGRKLDVQYKSLSSDEVYSYLPDNETPELQTGETLTPRSTARRFGVTQLSVSNGVGGYNTTTYTYANAKRNTLGYGDLGFGTITKIETIEGNTPLKTITAFYQDANQQYNLAGRIKRQRVYTSNSEGASLQLLSDARYQWKVRLYNDDVDSGYTSPHHFTYLYKSSRRIWDLDGSEVSTSLTQNHSYSTSSCTELATAPAILTAVNGGVDDVDYHADGVLLYSETATCDQSGSTASVQINAIENADIVTAGSARGLVKTRKTLAWVGNSISLADKSFYSVRTQGFTYNTLGQLESKTIEPDASAESRLKFTSTYTYNDYGSVNSITDTWDSASNSGLTINSRVTSIGETIDSAGNRTVVVTKPLALVETTVFEPLWGKPHRQTDANNLVTVTNYDELGRPNLVTYADGTKTQLDYRTCAANDLPSNSDCAWYAQSKTTGSSAQRTYYDGFGREVGTRQTGLDGRVVYTLQTYNSRGAAYQSTAPFHYGEAQKTVTASYDALGRVSSVAHPDGSSESRGYYGLRHTTTNRLNQTQTRYLNAAGWVMKSVDNANTPVDFTYWPFGDLKTTQVNNDVKTLVSVVYDNLGRKTEMTDPNTGKTIYTYNALDLIATQTDAKNQRTCFGYDALGRQTKRVDNATSTCTGTVQNWVYDTKTKGKGQLGSMSGINTDGTSYSEQYTYNNYGLPEATTSSFGGASYTIKQHYDAYSRPLGVTYPTGYVAANSYNSYGHLDQVNDSTGKTLWVANDADALGNIKQFTLGNGVVTTQTYNANTNVIESIRAVSGSLVIQDQHYQFDALGNLKSREDRKNSITQSFCYDGLNRLKAARFNGCSSAANDYNYDPLGNLTTKEGLTGTLGYGTAGSNVAGPHAVTSANGWSYKYDEIGNLKTATKAGEQTKTVNYSPFNTPTSITQGSKFSALVYGPNQDRIKHSDSNGRVTKYVGGIYEEVTKGGVTQKIHYVGDFALFIQTGATTPTNKHEYLHRDHIGSIVAISKGTIASASDINWQANGAWGERRYQQWNGPLDNLLIPTSTARGFTDHEHLDAVGLIHMNGRVYDPELGRFMSADPFVQAPYNSQSYNRYSYVFNNPLSFTDPSGYECYNVNVGSQTASGYQHDSQNQTVSTNGSLCGQDAFDFIRDQQWQQEWQNQMDRWTTSFVEQAFDFSGIPTVFGTAIDVHVAINMKDYSAIGPTVLAGVVELGSKKVKAVERVVDLAVDAKKAEKKVEGALDTKKADISTGRTEAKNLKEQLAMEEVKSNPSGVTPPRMPKMSDTKNNLLDEDGWVKRTQNVNGVEIHYVENINTKEFIDFKFKDL